MTKEEALKEMRTVCYGMGRDLEMTLIETLKRQIPKKPITKEEALKRIQELEEYLKNIGDKDNEIVLLSVEEYKKHRTVIPQISCWWWLCSPGFIKDCFATGVNDDGSVHYSGYFVDDASGCVRPALKLSNSESSNLEIGDKIIKCGYTWIYLGDNLAISEMPIMFTRFDKDSNDYETSEIRKKLLEWYEERKDY